MVTEKIPAAKENIYVINRNIIKINCHIYKNQSVSLFREKFDFCVRIM